MIKFEERFRYEACRLASFYENLILESASIQCGSYTYESLAAGGFFANIDYPSCFLCGLSILISNPTLSPEQIHQRDNPSCEFFSESYNIPLLQPQRVQKVVRKKDKVT